MANESNTTLLHIPSTYQILSVAFISLIITIGSIGNLVNIYFIYKTPSLHSFNNILIAHLAISDFLQAILTLPMAILNSYLRFNSPIILCRAFAFTLNFLVMVSLAATSAISIDRYFAVIYPYSYSAKMKIKYINIFIVSTWLSAAITSGTPLLGLQRYGLGEYSFIADGLQCWFDFQHHQKNRIAFIATFVYIVAAILVTMTSYLAIFYVACHKGITDVSVVGYASLKRSIRTTALIVGSNLACFIPVLVGASISYFTKRDLPPGLTVAVYLLTFFNPAINPVIYAYTNEILRRKIKQYCYCPCNPRFRQIKVRSNTTMSSLSCPNQLSQESNFILNQSITV
ncbi:Trace amine-associated receptor 1 [Trichoplax sp. H2]|uniref:G-protein coupled receptors family 1 profile domain-containing protein n=1 Tax=Trichoplax adhaerens TaxID=10228 RepID=B3RKG4_TRIAD|nr:hypothetical protein TRIADDRAFT_51671 [Trichoplax adhaerens]EDV28594.1 hypothetical protein TRIADDRAFT_51671 [Trichoplax adhaerens]RDD44707.1 Trace amine-associated receptor 1 [Trichoplax sp. H2]|eukprot:XP_002107796.1 hypothetical protein TRIADDRAFT_51671 [Trichoplax adhaerens]